MSHSKVDSWQTGTQGILTSRGTEDGDFRAPTTESGNSGISAQDRLPVDVVMTSIRAAAESAGADSASGQRLQGHDVQQFRLWGSQQIDQQLECIFVLLPGGAQDTGENRLRPGAVFGAIATPVLADHHQQTHHPFRQIVGGIHQTRDSTGR